jgi:uncharacterized protein (DUF427 family)
MSDPITIAPAPGTWVVRAAGAVLGESARALVLHEAGHEPVIYFPQADLAMAFLERSSKRTTSPGKGEASHFSIHAKSSVIADSAWCYEDPGPGIAAIAGHIAFCPDRVTVEKV